ncbi:MAG: SET domain-containing protein-lysine N-methyltransferase [Nitriliruptoraceae bacterium]
MFEVRSSARHGRGLFATEPIPRDTLLMHAPVLLISAEQREALQATIVDDYVYEWDDDGTAALVLGVSSMCNHAEEPNAYLWLVPDGPSAELVALVDIAPGEEITVSYRAEAGPETGPLWFTVREG